MKIKKHYKLGDTVWIYGIDRAGDQLRSGTIIKSFHIDHDSHRDIEHYVIEVPTDIEPILEIRTWKTISQDNNGPVGSIREALSDPESAKKYLSKIGVILADGTPNPIYYDDEPSDEEIHAALTQSQKSNSHQPFVLKDSKPKRKPRFTGRKRD